MICEVRNKFCNTLQHSFILEYSLIFVFGECVLPLCASNTYFYKTMRVVGGGGGGCTVRNKHASGIMVRTLCLTCRGDDHFGPAAGEAVQQRLGPDVEVEQGSRAAQLGQTEPSPHEAGLVGQKQGDGVPLLQPGFSLQSSGHLVALSIHFAIRIFPTFKVQKCLTGMPFSGVQEAVHDAVKRFDFLVFGEPDAQFNAPQDVRQVILKVWEKFLEEWQRQKSQSG